MNDAERIAKAERIQRLLTDPDLTAAFDAVRQAIFLTIEKAPIRDTEGLSHLRLCLKLLNDVRANLMVALNDGKLADFKMHQEEENKRRPFKDFFR